VGNGGVRVLGLFRHTRSMGIEGRSEGGVTWRGRDVVDMDTTRRVLIP
jgi:hypothetical protein